jgi:hypothetical protein
MMDDERSKHLDALMGYMVEEDRQAYAEEHPGLTPVEVADGLYRDLRRRHGWNLCWGEEEINDLAVRRGIPPITHDEAWLFDCLHVTYSVRLMSEPRTPEERAEEEAYEAAGMAAWKAREAEEARVKAAKAQAKADRIAAMRARGAEIRAANAAKKAAQ